MDRLEAELKKMLNEDIIEGPLDEEEPSTFIGNLVITDKKGTDQIRVMLDCQGVNNSSFQLINPYQQVGSYNTNLRGQINFPNLI